MTQNCNKKAFVLFLLTTSVLCENVVFQNDTILDPESQPERSCLKIEGYVSEFVRNFDVNRLLESHSEVKDKLSNMEACLGQKVEKVQDMISSMVKKEHVCPSNMICLERREQRKSGRFLGCYEDSRHQRILKGYATRLSFNTKESCVDICMEKKFVYAGTEAG